MTTIGSENIPLGLAKVNNSASTTYSTTDPSQSCHLCALLTSVYRVLPRVIESIEGRGLFKLVL